MPQDEGGTAVLGTSGPAFADDNLRQGRAGGGARTGRRPPGLHKRSCWLTDERSSNAQAGWEGGEEELGGSKAATPRSDGGIRPQTQMQRRQHPPKTLLGTRTEQSEEEPYMPTSSGTQRSRKRHERKETENR